MTKAKKCRNCQKMFRAWNSLHSACSPDCALELTRKDTAKEQEKIRKLEARRLRQKREALKTPGQHKKDLQVIFNRFIRLRDADLPCISCGSYHTGQYHAGHYRSVGACPELRFNEDNTNKQCSACNNYKSGNLIEYRINLINKIGKEKVEWLEGPHEPQNLTVKDIQKLKAVYRAKCKELEKKQREAA